MSDLTPQELARLAVEAFIRDGYRLKPPDEVEGMLAERAGVFVTLRMRGGALRGCIGTIQPANENVAAEIIENAISAATRDPRFTRVTPDELSDLTYGVDVLSPTETVSGVEDLDPARYGVIIETPDGRRRGLLLPRIAGIDSAQEQWQAVHMKAGIRLNQPVRVARFTVTRFGKD
ncbi:MAG TPA: AmmeMemoRadiSam system protein A [Blastocatellia bacterium]|nr:AmmeMemoRadiSam system protein A [Blastocatellia bacterium]